MHDDYSGDTGAHAFLFLGKIRERRSDSSEDATPTVPPLSTSSDKLNSPQSQTICHRQGFALQDRQRQSETLNKQTDIITYGGGHVFSVPS